MAFKPTPGRVTSRTVAMLVVLATVLGLSVAARDWVGWTTSRLGSGFMAVVSVVLLLSAWGVGGIAITQLRAQGATRRSVLWLTGSLLLCIAASLTLSALW